ncbi:MAG TPA: GT-D fold domain-containing glycosyltransferase [Lactovum miscens]|uniref:GT-D fold domain-containing glycosyltransferase n=1 Tax=Lactovum miscens TaxID=190387 RepID=UPI002ED99BCF
MLNFLYTNMGNNMRNFMRLIFKITSILVVHKSYPDVMTADETIDFIIKNHCSVSRFGDGELSYLVGNRNPTFQPWSKKLANELKNLSKYNGSNEKILVCVPDIFCDARLDRLTDNIKNFWIINRKKYTFYWKNFSKNHQYGDSLFSRFYTPLKNKGEAKIFISKVKNIWDKKNVLIIEGELSRLGVGNDLFENAAKTRRVLAPSVNAYSKIDQIEEYVTSKISRKDLILLALGPTATVLSMRLSNLGYQAIDIGHLDIEYEWLKIQADKKVPIEGKFVYEAGDMDKERTISIPKNQQYQNEILVKIL